MTLVSRIENTIRDVHDFPKPGIVFKDITPIMQDAALCNDICEQLAKDYQSAGVEAIAGVESRGFLFGLPVAMKMGVPFILIRKKGKLPYETISYKYDLEYGSAEIEMHTDAFEPNTRVLIHDDLLATGGTAGATAELIKQAGGQVAGFSFLVELEFLNGKEKLTPYSDQIMALVKY